MHSPKLEDILDDWQHWDIALENRPRLVSRLKGGLTNRSYLISGHVSGHVSGDISSNGSSRARVNEKQFVLRLHSCDAQNFGIKRSHEKIILEALKPLGISPKLLFWGNEKDYSLFAFISGRTLTPKDLLSPIIRFKMRQLIKAYRRLEVPLPPFDYLEHLKLYWDSLSANKKRYASVRCGSWQRLAKQINIYNRLNTERVLTHHDLNPANFLMFENRLYLLDWEYAGLGFGEFDSHMLLSKSAIKKSPYLTDSRSRCVQSTMNWLNFTWRLKSSTN